MTADPAPRLHLDMLLTPHRSLSRRGFRVIMLIVVAYNLLVAGFLLLIGAYPVPVFLGLDVLALFLAFRFSYAGGRGGERVQVTADQVRVLRPGRGGGEQLVWASPTAFTRVQVDPPTRPGAGVRLQLSGRGLRLATRLGPRQRAEFAEALDAAIRAARLERHD